MKKLYFFVAFLVVGSSVLANSKASENSAFRGYGDAFIFTEGGVEFAVFPDGQFDFFYKPRRVPVRYLSAHGTHITYNSGYNYDPFVQYDDFGAVIQIENVPVYYDYYGRIIQAGRVRISYNHFGMLSRVGNLYLHYNPYNHYTHYTGYINAYNPYYVYRPWHDHYMRPYSYQAVVFHQPYRAYYDPYRVKYSQHKKYYKRNYNDDFRRSYYRPGDRVASYHRGRRVDAPRAVGSDAGPARIETANRTRQSVQPSVQPRENYHERSQNMRDVRPADVRRVQPQQEAVRTVRNARIERSEAPAARVTEESAQRQRQVPEQTQRQAPVETQRQVRETRQEQPQMRSSRSAEVVQPQVRQTEEARPATSRSSRGRN